MTIAVERPQTSRELSELEQAIFERLRERLADRDLTEYGSADEIADRFMASLPDAGIELARAVGPCFRSQGLQKWLGISRQALNQHVQARRILRLVTSDGVSIYPGFQFDNNGERLPHLKDVLDILATGINDPWTWAMWLTTPDDGGVTSATQLRNGEWKKVFDDAMEDAAAWSRP